MRVPLHRRIAELEKRLAAVFRGRANTTKSRYTPLLEQMPEPALVHSRGRIVYINPAAMALFGGVSLENPVSRRREALDHSKLGDAIRELVRDALDRNSGREPVRRAFIGMRPSEITIETRSVRIDWNGRPAKLLTMRQAGGTESGIAAAEPEATATDSPADPVVDGIWDWDPDTGQMYLSRRLRGALGYGSDDVASTEVSWSDLVHPDDRAANDRRLQDHLEGVEPLFLSQFRARLKNGTYVPVRARGKAARDTNGRVHRVAGTLRTDVAPAQSPAIPTAGGAQGNRDSRELLITAMDAAGVGLAVYDADDRLVLFNDEYRDGIPQMRDFIVPGATFEEILRPQIEAGLVPLAGLLPEEWLQQRLQRHREGRGAFDAQLADGRTLRFTELKTQAGEIVTMRTDISKAAQTERDLQARVDELESTERKLEEQGQQLTEIAEELTRARDEADTANHTKSEFLANMSHELRTPLNAIMGFSEVIKDQMFGPEGARQYVDYAKDIYSSGAHLLEIINDILDLSKVEAGKLELAEEPIDLHEVAGAVMQLVKSRAEAGGVTMLQNIPDGLPMLHADKRKLKQMLLNLLSNAIKFTKENGVVDLMAEVAADGAIRISVRDTGIGISPDQYDLVLSPFGQVDSALAREHQGTGLGLPLVKALMELHGGRLEIRSAVDQGTVAVLAFDAAHSIAPARKIQVRRST